MAQKQPWALLLLCLLLRLLLLPLPLAVLLPLLGSDAAAVALVPSSPAAGLPSAGAAATGSQQPALLPDVTLQAHPSQSSLPSIQLLQSMLSTANAGTSMLTGQRDQLATQFKGALLRIDELADKLCNSDLQFRHISPQG